MAGFRPEPEPEPNSGTALVTMSLRTEARNHCYRCCCIRFICWPEQYKIHRLLAVVVELVEVALHHVPQLFHITHLLVVIRVRLRVAEVAEHQAAQVVLGHVTVTTTTGQVRKQSVKVDIHVTIDDVTDVWKQPGAVLIVNKTVVENTERLQKW